MKILFDLFFAQPIGDSKFHGGGEYIKTIFRQLLTMHVCEYNIDVFFNTDAFLDDWILKLINSNNIRIYDVKSIKEVENIFTQDSYDVFYSGMPYNYFKISIPINVRKIGTFHGLRFAEKPSDKYAYLYKSGKDSVKLWIKNFFNIHSQRKAIKYYQKGLSSFDDIVTVSNHTKYAIKSICGIDNKPIHVFYTPAKFVEIAELVENDTTTYNTEKYILIVGGNRWEKNIARVIWAIEDLLASNKLCDYKIKIVGKLPLKIKKYIKHIEKYEFYGYVETEHLEKLYQKCDFFIYASLNEGFGMPPLEAMKYGKTCIVSCVCSLPEICGNVVYYINPYDINEIKNRILRAVDSKISYYDIIKHFKYIYIRQKNDLSGICEFIVKGNKV